MDTPQVIAAATSIVAAMSAAIGLVWRAGEDKSKRIELVWQERVKDTNTVWQGRLEDSRGENTWLKQQLTDLKTTFANEAREDRVVLEKFREMLQTSTSRPRS